MERADAPAEHPHLPLTAFATLGDFVLGRATALPAETVRAANLSAFAYSALGIEHPDRAGYKDEFLASLGRHHAIVQEVAPLIAAWRAAGIEALVFKGFHLAEFVYPVAGTRHHGDVDLILRPADLRRAAGIAHDLGWSGWPPPIAPPGPDGHLAYNLFRPGGAARLDVQRYVVHAAHPFVARQRRLTEAVWERSLEQRWEGTVLRIPHPVDAALVCLLVHRAWGSEAWGLKPHDLLDLRYLTERAGVTHDAMEARAAELGCGRTLSAMLERCNPWTGAFAVGRASRLRSWSLDLRTFTEHAPIRLLRAVMRGTRAPAVGRDVMRMLPHVLAARVAARRKTDLNRLLRSITPTSTGAPAPITLNERMRSVRGIRWSQRLLPDGGVGSCVVRALVLYRALRKRGLPVVFVSGVRRVGSEVVGHAWVELDGEVLPELGEPSNRAIYSINFQYPTPPAGSPAGQYAPRREAKQNPLAMTRGGSG